MRKVHDIRFPRYAEDVASERRTLFHVPIDDETWDVGDGLRLISHSKAVHYKVAVLIAVRKVRLRADLGADLGKLGTTDRAAYLASWDSIYPGQPSVSDPEVWRIEFRYGMWEADPTDPPEWSLAS